MLSWYHPLLLLAIWCAFLAANSSFPAIAAVVPGQEPWPIDRMAASHHFFRDVFPVDEALGHDAFVTGGL